MKWYGLSNIRAQMPVNNNLHKYRSLRMRSWNLIINTNNAYNWPLFEIIWPPQWHVICVKINSALNNFYLFTFYTENWMYTIPLNTSYLLFIDNSANKIFISNFPTQPLLTKAFFKFFLSLIPIIRFFVLKLKFRGKGFYLYKNKRNMLRFRFGFSHRVNRRFPNTHVRLTSKTSLMIFGYNWYDITHAGLYIWLVRPINVYTGKGIRFNRQIIYRKAGKMSTYR